MLQSYKLGQGSIVLRIKLRDSTVSTGAGKTGLTSSSTGLIIAVIADNESSTTAYTQAGSTIESITTLGTYAAPTATKCRFKEVDSTNHKGIYEIQIADARFNVSNSKSVLISISGVTGLAECDAVIPLTTFDPYSSTVDANVTKLLGTAWLTPGTAGTPDVNVKLAGGTAWNSGAIGASTLATDTITAAKIAADAIGASELASDAVTEILTALWAKVVGYGSTTFEEHLIIMGAASAGKTSGVGVGAPVFRDLDDTKDVISGSLDGSKNRTSSTLTP